MSQETNPQETVLADLRTQVKRLAGFLDDLAGAASDARASLEDWANSLPAEPDEPLIGSLAFVNLAYQEVARSWVRTEVLAGVAVKLRGHARHPRAVEKEGG